MEEVFILIGFLGPQASESSIAILVKESVESDFPAIANGIREKISLRDFTRLAIS